MSTVRWRPPSGIGADRIADWMCSAARELCPRLSADSHTAVHAVANALADDLVVNGEWPIDLTVQDTADGLAICVTDGRDYAARAARSLSPTLAEIRTLTTRLQVQPADGRPGCTLTAAVSLPRNECRTQRSRLRRLHRGRP